ncbi:hypothetical protein Xph01_58300 [Micromonospora phaseoli]|nr:hypothetical protein Xph01_58300 [Micromonospora phaseoli]
MLIDAETGLSGGPEGTGGQGRVDEEWHGSIIANQRSPRAGYGRAPPGMGACGAADEPSLDEFDAKGVGRGPKSESDWAVRSSAEACAADRYLVGGRPGT